MSHDSPPSVGYDDHPPEGAQVGSGAAQRSARFWPAWARRGPMEIAACIVIAVGIFMMLQPFALILFTWSFVVTLAGVVMFTIVSKFPS